MNNITLIGYRGSGKTTIGKKLAKILNMPFYDSDAEIVKEGKIDIPRIFKEYGESYFRDMEERVIKKLANMHGIVLATGGGVVMREINMKRLKNSGIIVYLEADIDTIYKRIYKDSNRPPLTDKDMLDEINYMLKLRIPIYEKYADFVVNTANLNVDSVVKRILSYITSLK